MIESRWIKIPQLGGRDKAAPLEISDPVSGCGHCPDRGPEPPLNCSSSERNVRILVCHSSAPATAAARSRFLPPLSLVQPGSASLLLISSPHRSENKHGEIKFLKARDHHKYSTAQSSSCHNSLVRHQYFDCLLGCRFVSS